MITRLGVRDAKTIAKIHASALKDDFLPSLGINFLTIFYKGLYAIKGVSIFGSKRGTRITGFIVGTDDMSGLFKKILKNNFLTLSWFLFLTVIRKPALIIKIAETFLYPGKEAGPKAELVVIAIQKNYQGKGLGKSLVKELEREFRKNKVKEYKLTVHADKKAVRFYEKLKYKRIGEFMLYGKEWFIYSRKI